MTHGIPPHNYYMYTVHTRSLHTAITLHTGSLHTNTTRHTGSLLHARQSGARSYYSGTGCHTSANLNNLPLQLVSFDIAKAFDRISHAVILEALRIMGYTELLVQALDHYGCQGWAYVEVNGVKGGLIDVLRGCGQGNPLSCFFFLAGTEPLNRALSFNHRELKFVLRDGTSADPIVYLMTMRISSTFERELI